MNTRNQIKNQLRNKLARNHNAFPWYVVQYSDGQTAVLNSQEYDSLRGTRNAEIANRQEGHAYQTLQSFSHPDMAVEASAHPSKLQIG